MSLCQLLVGWLPPSYIIFWRSFPYNLGQFSSNKNIVAKQKFLVHFEVKMKKPRAIHFHSQRTLCLSLRVCLVTY